MELLATLASYFGLFLAGANVAIFCIIKFNDLKHLEDTAKRIESKVESIDKKVDGVVERVAKIEGTCQANHKK